MDFGFTGVAAITAICYAAAEVFKAARLADNRWLPPLCMAMGGLLGAVALRIMTAYPADDLLNGIAVGIVSGAAATCVNQTLRQLRA